MSQTTTLNIFLETRIGWKRMKRKEMDFKLMRVIRLSWWDWDQNFGKANKLRFLWLNMRNEYAKQRKKLETMHIPAILSFYLNIMLYMDKEKLLRPNKNSCWICMLNLDIIKCYHWLTSKNQNEETLLNIGQSLESTEESCLGSRVKLVKE